MTFEEWWKKKAPDINKALKNNHDYIKPFFENAYIWGKATSEKEEQERIRNQPLCCASCGDEMDRDCPKCLKFARIDEMKGNKSGDKT